MNNMRIYTIILFAGAFAFVSSMNNAMQNTKSKSVEPTLQEIRLPSCPHGEVYKGFYGKEYKVLASQIRLFDFHFIGTGIIEGRKKFCCIADVDANQYITFDVDKDEELSGFRYNAGSDCYSKNSISADDVNAQSDFNKVAELYNFIYELEKYVLTQKNTFKNAQNAR